MFPSPANRLTPCFKSQIHLPKKYETIGRSDRLWNGWVEQPFRILMVRGPSSTKQWSGRSKSISTTNILLSASASGHSYPGSSVTLVRAQRLVLNSKSFLSSIRVLPFLLHVLFKKGVTRGVTMNLSMLFFQSRRPSLTVDNGFFGEPNPLTGQYSYGPQ